MQAKTEKGCANWDTHNTDYSHPEYCRSEHIRPVRNLAVDHSLAAHTAAGNHRKIDFGLPVHLAGCSNFGSGSQTGCMRLQSFGSGKIGLQA